MARQPWYKLKLDKTSARLIAALCLSALFVGFALDGAADLVARGVLVLTALVIFVVALRKSMASADAGATSSNR